MSNQPATRHSSHTPVAVGPTAGGVATAPSWISLFWLLTAALSFGTYAEARAAPSQLCDQVAVEAAARTGVPISVLKSITRTETGRNRNGRVEPWPWTVNMEGKGVWFETADAAQAYAYEHYKRGARSFDVGCFQINYKWHHEAFSSLEQMFDPVSNAVYAAEFLRQLYQESGSWEDAAGAYHSRTPEYADRYKARFSQFRADLQHEDGRPLVVAATAPLTAQGYGQGYGEGYGKDGGSASNLVSKTAPIPVPARPRVNSFPLLQGGGQAALGSLVPLSSTGAGASLFAPGEAG